MNPCGADGERCRRWPWPWRRPAASAARATPAAPGSAAGPEQRARRGCGSRCSSPAVLLGLRRPASRSSADAVEQRGGVGGDRRERRPRGAGSGAAEEAQHERVEALVARRASCALRQPVGAPVPSMSGRAPRARRWRRPSGLRRPAPSRGRSRAGRRCRGRERVDRAVEPELRRIERAVGEVVPGRGERRGGRQRRRENERRRHRVRAERDRGRRRRAGAPPRPFSSGQQARPGDVDAPLGDDPVPCVTWPIAAFTTVVSTNWNERRRSPMACG